MNALNSGFVWSEAKNRLCFRIRSCFIVMFVFFGAYFAGNALIAKEYKGIKKYISPFTHLDLRRDPMNANATVRLARWGVMNTSQIMKFTASACESQCRPSGAETLPEGIVAQKSNLEMQSLCDSGVHNRHSKPPLNLLAIAAGIKQKEIVNKIVEKFPLNEYVVMLFHYDGLVDGWSRFSWTDHAIHVSAINQTKWWFAKRFLHPDIVADYNYIFLWDEDLGVENFNPNRYLSIVKEEGLEISQPALDRKKSKMHHRLTGRKNGSRVHRRYLKPSGNVTCDEHSRGPPCTGWVEMMAPVFSKNSWPCVWHMIQNDLVHAWGLDRKLGYCAQGDRTRNVGVVDSEYIVHFGLPTLGGSKNNQDSRTNIARTKVRMESYMEMHTFERRWNYAIKKDKCWIDPYGQTGNQISPQPKY